ncbi:carbohydrate sulfotransferase 3-like [Leptidea sinapis]|uniref:carbohydrate sulfotransferase 3-like n=1 Tax=Leptidea sinapis TaxID=189913 RepID=UPI0021415888|nr:carbohydrate sulfotransferase 3-like [Leptidea sinapis]
MLRRVNFYSICIAFGLSILLILAGSRYTDNNYYRPSPESRSIVEVNLPQLTSSSSNYDTEATIEKIFEKTRAKIQMEMKNYNYSFSGVSKLEDLLMESNGQPIRSIIISTWRSGTTFLGEVLNSVPGNFYHYEPLLKYDIIQIRGAPHADNALKMLKKMMLCDFSEMDDYFKYGKTHLHQFSHNTRLWDHCKFKKDLCLDAQFTSSFCKLFPFQSMKVVRVRLRLIKQLLEDKELNIKVMLLVRDPRGVMQSRQHRNFCQPAPDCWEPELLCADMVSDYVAAGRLLQKYPDRLIVQRYEELALSPNATTHQLLRFLGISPTSSVEDFLLTHTNVEVSGVSSTFRVSREVPFKWKNTLDFNYVEDIQDACKEAMNLWGYKVAHNASQMTSKDFYPLDNYTISQ